MFTFGKSDRNNSQLQGNAAKSSQALGVLVHACLQNSSAVALKESHFGEILSMVLRRWLKRGAAPFSLHKRFFDHPLWPLTLLLNSRVRCQNEFLP